MESGTSSAQAAAAAAAARIHELEQQLETVRQEQAAYVRHCQALEGVCWDVLDDVARGEEAGEGHIHVYPASFSLRDSAAAAPLSRPPWQRCSGAHAAASRLRSASPPLPPRGASAVSSSEAHLLLERLGTLRQWMHDLVVGLHAARPMQRPHDAWRAAERGTTTTATAASVSADAGSSADVVGADSSMEQLTRAAPHPQRVGPATLHRAVDDVFVCFTQLQAMLTDVVWDTAHPPALSTPARTYGDRHVEVERLRAINQDLRRTLRGYEQSCSATRRGESSSRRGATTTTTTAAEAATSMPPPPPTGYAATKEAGLVVAVRRR
ncbi:hypothetical protein NESM_000598800 [Novymonas esmeraldas]|uniref:Uncharacterized protein n=1 Tax=Novymonas esmeraldas TaxID=1808958 RepID=A0AAW0EQW3_9TRYP